MPAAPRIAASVQKLMPITGTGVSGFGAAGRVGETSPKLASNVVPVHVRPAVFTEKEQQLIERDTHQERGLADARTGDHEAEVAVPEASMKAFFEQAQRRTSVQEAAIHHSSSLRRSAYFSSNSFVTSFGQGR